MTDQQQVQQLIALQDQYRARFGDAYPTEETGETFEEIAASISRCLEAGEPYAGSAPGENVY